MNYLVLLDAQAGELEKILSGTKSMLVKDFDPAQTSGRLIMPGDSLYFLRNKEEQALRVKATVVRVLSLSSHVENDVSHILKEMQPGLQLTEGQFNHWSAKDRVLLVEFCSAHKIGPVRVPARAIADKPDWIAFEDINQIT